jgi:hypothetical protein
MNYNLSEDEELFVIAKYPRVHPGQSLEFDHFRINGDYSTSCS